MTQTCSKVLGDHLVEVLCLASWQGTAKQGDI